MGRVLLDQDDLLVDRLPEFWGVEEDHLRFIDAIEHGVVPDQTLLEAALNGPATVIRLSVWDNWNANRLQELQELIDHLALIIFINQLRVETLDASFESALCCSTFNDLKLKCQAFMGQQHEGNKTIGFLLNSILAYKCHGCDSNNSYQDAWFSDSDLHALVQCLCEYENLYGLHLPIGPVLFEMPNCAYETVNYLASLCQLESLYKHPIGNLPVSCFHGTLIVLSQLGIGESEMMKWDVIPVRTLCSPSGGQINTDVASAIMPRPFSQEVLEEAKTWIEIDNACGEVRGNPKYLLTADGYDALVEFEAASWPRQQLMLLSSLLLLRQEIPVDIRDDDTVAIIFGVAGVEARLISQCLYGQDPCLSLPDECTRALGSIGMNPLRLSKSSRSAIVRTTLAFLACDKYSKITFSEGLPDLSPFVDKCTESLDEREKIIFIERSDRLSTLQQIGDKLGVTRERIRQLENEYLKGIQDTWQIHARVIVRRWQDILFCFIASECVANSNFEPTTDQVNAKVNIGWNAICAIANMKVDFKRMICDQIHIFKSLHLFGLQKTNVTNSEVIKAEVLLDGILSRKQVLPILVKNLDGYSPEFISAICKTKQFQSKRISLQKTAAGPAILTEDKAGDRLFAQVIGIYDLHPDWILSDQLLWHHLRNHVGDRNVQSLWRRTCNILQKRSSRFRRIRRLGWIDLKDMATSIDQDTKMVLPITKGYGMALGDVQEALSPSTKSLYDTLSVLGGAGYTELRDIWVRDTIGNPHSIPFLLDQPFFTAAHPGMFGCLDADGQLVNPQRIRERLQNPISLCHYLQLRQAGFPPNAYPIWDRAMLQFWQEYVQTHIVDSVAARVVDFLDRDISCLLPNLDVLSEDANISFPVQLACLPWQPVDNIVPDAESVFRVLAYCSRFGFTNLYLINYCAGTQWYSGRAVSWLALFIAAGVIMPGEHWQAPHTLTSWSRDLLRTLTETARNFDALTWNKHKPCQELIEAAREHWQANIAGSWLDTPEQKLELINLLETLADPYTRDRTRILNPIPTRVRSIQSDIVLPMKHQKPSAEYLNPFIVELLNSNDD